MSKRFVPFYIINYCTKLFKKYSIDIIQKTEIKKVEKRIKVGKPSLKKIFCIYIFLWGGGGANICCPSLILNKRKVNIYYLIM